MKSSEELAALFRARDMRVTPQRRAIFAILGESEQHPTAEAVFETARQQMPTMSLRTVYQTLNDLAAMGELDKLRLGPGSSRFDPNTESHHHLVCEACGEVADLHADLIDFSVPDDIVEGFRITSTEVVLRGRCAECVDEEGSSASNQKNPNQQGELQTHG